MTFTLVYVERAVSTANSRAEVYFNC